MRSQRPQFHDIAPVRVVLGSSTTRQGRAEVKSQTVSRRCLTGSARAIIPGAALFSVAWRIHDAEADYR